MPYRYLPALALIGVLIFAAPAHALRVTPTLEVEHSFTGSACGSTNGRLVVLPRGARAPQILRPSVGDVLASDDDDVTPVAEITAADVGPLGGRLVAGFQAVGSGDVCTNPQNYAVDGWATVDVDLVVRFVQNVRTFVRGFGSGIARRRPARLNVGVGTLTRLRWRSWDTRTVRGRGLGPGGLPVTVRLSRPRDCGRWRYLTVRYRYTGRVPDGARRRRTVRLDSTCR